MADDIVTRLRKRAAIEAANESYFNSLLEKAGMREYMINSLSYEAADEIERLRSVVANLSDTRKVGSFTPEKPKDTIKRRAW